MVRSQTKSRKATAVSTASAVPAAIKSIDTRKAGPNRPKKAVVQIDSLFSSSKPVTKKAAKRTALRPPPQLSPFFTRRNTPALPKEDQDMEHMQTATRLARIHIGQNQAACDNAVNLINTVKGFACFFIDMYNSSVSLRLPEVRPILIQECLKENPFLMVVAVIFLNKTTGTKAVPKFYEVVQRWSTPEAFAQADPNELFTIIDELGLGNIRTDALIKLGKMWLTHPPVTPQMLQDDPEAACAQRAVNANLARKKNPLFKGFSDVDMPAIAHLPWVAEYAVDSYQIYCCGEDGWKSARPADKELTRYVMWRWAMLGRAYDVEASVPRGYATPKYIEALIHELVEFSPYKTLDRLSDEARAAQVSSAQVV